MRVVFISSLARSGSTALGMLLGTHPDLVYLGEVYNVIGPRYDLEKTSRSSVKCTCGHLPGECRFWGSMMSELRAHQSDDIGGRYRRLLEVFRSTFGPKAVLVDSSKELGALKVLLSVGGPTDTKVLHLLRDVRSWTAVGKKKEITVRVPPHREQAKTTEKLPGDERLVDLVTAPHDLLSNGYTVRKNRGGDGQLAGFDVVLPVPPSNGHSATRLFLTWYARNRQIGSFLAAKNIPHFTVGYEEFAIKTGIVMERIHGFLGLEPAPNAGQLDANRSHAILGNRMIWDEHSRAMIEYDPAWLYGDPCIGPSLLLPFVVRYNKQNVYRNISRGSSG